MFRTFGASSGTTLTRSRDDVSLRRGSADRDRDLDRRIGEGDLRRNAGDGDLRRNAGDGDLRRNAGDGDLRRGAGEGDLRCLLEGDRRRGEGDLLRDDGERRAGDGDLRRGDTDLRPGELDLSPILLSGPVLATNSTVMLCPWKRVLSDSARALTASSMCLNSTNA